jgi:hypothetical protein
MKLDLPALSSRNCIAERKCRTRCADRETVGITRWRGLYLKFRNSQDIVIRLTTRLSDAGGPARSNCQLTWPARVRSSDFVRRYSGLCTIGLWRNDLRSILRHCSFQGLGPIQNSRKEFFRHHRGRRRLRFAAPTGQDHVAAFLALFVCTRSCGGPNEGALVHACPAG